MRIVALLQRLLRALVPILPGLALAALAALAVTKLHVSGLAGIAESRNFPIQRAKNFRMQYYNTREDANTGFRVTLPHKAKAAFL